MREFTDTELAQEQWRDVEGYDGVYQVSDLGRVRSKKYGKVRVLSPGRCSNGYLKVNLYKDKQKKNRMIHRLVASAFIENTDSSKTYINHTDECKQNNRVSNLEYCTQQYNTNYNGIQYRRKHPNYKRNEIKDIYDPKLSIKQNLEIFRANGIECSYSTIRRLRRELGLTKQIE